MINYSGVLIHLINMDDRHTSDGNREAIPVTDNTYRWM